MFNFIFLVVGLLAGVIATYFIVKGNFGIGKTDTLTINTHTIVERIERVFKVVTAEGHFSEIYDYSNTSHLFTLIPSTKKALVIVNAKVMMGYDFKKFQYEIDEQTKEIKIISFPKAEILSIEPDLKYYNLEHGFFNKFDNKDLTQLQSEAKSKIAESVAKSDLPAIAAKQIKTLILEMANMSQFQIQGADIIGKSTIHFIESEKNKDA